MLPVLQYYSCNPVPTDEEIQQCIDIAKKTKSVVLLYLALNENDKNTAVHHVFIHAKDTVANVNYRRQIGYVLH